jgi:hypothetical protein
MKAIVKALSVCLMIILTSGCASRDIAEKGIVGWSYQPVGSAHRQQAHTGLSIRVAKFSGPPPSVTQNMGLFFPALIPVVGLFLPPVAQATNAMHYPNGVTAKGFQPGELETIVADELQRTQLFRVVTTADVPTDLILSGTIDLRRKTYGHYGGLGIIWVCTGIVGWVIIPMVTVDDSCQATFVITSTAPGKKRYARDFHARSRVLVSLRNSDTEFANYGRRLFPSLMEQFLTDLGPASSKLNAD